MRDIRITLFAITIILISVGIVMIYSASAIYSLENLGDSLFFLKRHLIYVTIGFLCMFFVMSLNLVSLRKFVKPLFIFSTFLLVLVLVPGLGKEVSGARRWFRFWIFSFQPSEFVKIIFILYIADLLAKKQTRIKSFLHSFLPVMLISGCTVGLILMQPDLGMAVLLSIVVSIMSFAAGINLVYLSLVLISSLPLLYVLISSVPYRKNRIIAFLNPWKDPRGTGFQIIQSCLALGSGGLLGVGLGQSRQKLFYLPAAHTDFIFSIIGEELGFLGTAGVLGLFIIFIWQGAKIAFNSRDSFSQLLALGIVSIIALEAIINIGVSSGSLPTKGLPLPFISYGGSALIFNMMGVGLLLNIAKES